ncbi:MAG: BREX-2 system adenine-specific DNA-methyltransferase PglX, partial [Chloroflexia bacterium]|nr:BREX-2 system adenine-specific DNA-methyltransferase PglX [Chloroflexia bacterium]
PPYITVKDPGLNALYRQLYPDTCHMKYSLVVPFTERFFNLAQPATRSEPAGYVGLIVADSFMKREFGKKLIEGFLPRLDLTHVIATSGAYIPGHGTPTVILFGRNRSPAEPSVRTVMGIKGEPGVPDDPARGLVWTAILDQLDRAGSEGEFVSVADVPRGVFGRHPWSIGGGGAVDIREILEGSGTRTLNKVADIGIAVVTLEDEAFQIPKDLVARRRIPQEYVRGFVVGDVVRDWRLETGSVALFPHHPATFDAQMTEEIFRWLWPLKTGLSNRLWFKKTQVERGLKWYGYGHISAEKFRTALSITYAEIATHNHFVLDRGGKVFNRTAPVIKLPAGATEDDHLGLLGLLNSSAGCFWLKQVC